MSILEPPESCECGKDTIRTVLESPGGFYIGSICRKCGLPWSRDSIYYGSREMALDSLRNNTWVHLEEAKIEKSYQKFVR